MKLSHVDKTFQRSNGYLFQQWAGLPALVSALCLAVQTTISWASEDSFKAPTINRIAPEELLAPLEGRGERAVIPQGIQLRSVYPRGLKTTKTAEGWVPHLYNDAAGYCTIGYGHLFKKARCNGAERLEVGPAQTIQARHGLTEAQGSFVLENDTATAKYTVMTAVNPHIKLTDGQFAALTDFIFNVGGQNFQRSGLLQAVNDGNFEHVPAQFRRWVLAGGKRWPGLVKRREEEITLFFDGLPTPKELPPLPGENLSPIDIRKGE
ncbi:lysozyme [Paraburkholderia strydomiana]|uniref:lysozyme n=1 Tax=Paraburkholderia strydomiana TaxID=1245417 RepID=UPI0038BA13D4